MAEPKVVATPREAAIETLNTVDAFRRNAGERVPHGFHESIACTIAVAQAWATLDLADAVRELAEAAKADA